ncbi:hypothetical protein BOX15_Mlig001609g1, partial [Macrostomum lignano]
SPLAEWVRPCRCRGDTKWVHQHCVQRWVDEKQRGNTALTVSCNACNAEYLIFYPPKDTLLYLMERVDQMVMHICPFFAGIVLVGSVYWTAVTYGAVSVMQVLGHSDGLRFMERMDPMMLLVGLPCIPLVLVAAKMVRWEEALVRLVRTYGPKLFRLRSRPAPRQSLQQQQQQQPVQPPPQPPPVEFGLAAHPVSVSRVLCGALALPTVSTVVGKLLFRRVSSSLQRTLLGCFAFVVLKGLTKLIYHQKKWLFVTDRRVLNHPDGTDEDT